MMRKALIGVAAAAFAAGASAKDSGSGGALVVQEDRFERGARTEDEPGDAGAGGLPRGGGWELLWWDDFDGPTLNTSLWTVTNGTGPSSNQIEVYLAENVSLEGGSLVLTSRLQNGTSGGMPFNVSSGRVDTSYKGNVTAFPSATRVEVTARLQAADAFGIHTAHWLLGYEGCWPVMGELDIMEMEIESSSVRSTSNVHTGTECTKDLNTAGAADFPDAPSGTNPVNFTAVFNTFAVEWNATSVSYFVNETLVKTWTQGEPSGRWANVTLPDPAKPMYLILSQAYMAWRHENPPATAWPVRQFIDSVRAYTWVAAGQSASSPGTEAPSPLFLADADSGGAAGNEART